MLSENKLGITNDAKPPKEEEKISKIKAVKRFEEHFLDRLLLDL